MKTRLSLVMGAVLLLGACGGSAGQGESSGNGGEDRFTVVTDMYPSTFAVEQVAGDDVEIIQLAPQGVEPHDYELTPKQIAQVADADLVAYLPGMIPAVSEAVSQEAGDRAVDLTQGIRRLPGPDGGDSGDASGGDGDQHAATGDPHVWLDPANMLQMGRSAADALGAAGVQADVGDLTTVTEKLDLQARDLLAQCAITPMVVSHAAFGYLADAFGFDQVGISGLSPDAEPSPKRMAEIADLVRDHGVTTIYFESLASPAAADAIAAETGVQTALLDPIEGNTDDRGYEELMAANIATLHSGQGCS